MILEIKHLTKRFGDKVALHDLNLDISEGEIVGFLGHNGAGKTTTIKQIVTLLPIDEGSISVCGHDVATDALAAKRELAYVPDNPDLYEFMKAIDYLHFIGNVFGCDSETLDANIDDLALRFDIRDDLNTKLSDFSHGMKQKIALIGAFMHKPKLILLDEPFVGLDPKSSFEVKKLMREFCDAGASIFFSTHVLEVAEKLCDRLAIIRRGELVVFDDTDKVLGGHDLEEVFLELEAEGDADAVATH